MNVTPLRPTADWPWVACTGCSTIYKAADTNGLVTERCPDCGSGTFNTTMTVPARQTVSTVDFPKAS